MANLDTPFGVRPVRFLSGAPFNGQTMRCYGATGYATAIFLGDPVVWAGSACANGCCPDINVATAGDGNKWLGGVVSIEPAVSTSLVYRAASTERYCNVAVDPAIIYEIQASGTNTLSKTIVGLNAVFIAGSGSTITGLSAWEMDSGDADAPAADGSNQLLIVGCVDRSDNDIASYNSKWLVLNNLHSFVVASPTGTGTTATGALGV